MIHHVHALLPASPPLVTIVQIWIWKGAMSTLCVHHYYKQTQPAESPCERERGKKWQTGKRWPFRPPPPLLLLLRLTHKRTFVDTILLIHGSERRVNRGRQLSGPIVVVACGAAPSKTRPPMYAYSPRTSMAKTKLRHILVLLLNNCNCWHLSRSLSLCCLYTTKQIPSGCVRVVFRCFGQTLALPICYIYVCFVWLCPDHGAVYSQEDGSMSVYLHNTLPMTWSTVVADCDGALITMCV